MNINPIMNQQIYNYQKAKSEPIEMDSFNSNYPKNTTTTNPYRILDNCYMPIFTGKKPVNPKLEEEIKFAEAVVNNIKNKYPTVSPSKVLLTFDKEHFTKSQKNWTNEKQDELQELRKEYPSTTKPIEFIDNLMKNIQTKGKKYANCYELTKLAETALRANGIKNISTVSLKGYTNPKFKSTYSMDHTFLVVNGDFSYEKSNIEWNKPNEKYGKKAYVVDPWLGITDTVENALEIYKKTWEKIPHYNGVIGYGFEETNSLDMNKNQIEKIKEKYPNLVLKPTENLYRYQK